MKKKAKIEDLRKYILERHAIEGQPTDGTDPHRTGRRGTMANGVVLEKLKPYIDAIPDEVDRRTVRGYFETFTQYEALRMMIHDRTPVVKKFPALAEEIVRAGVELDLDMEARAKR